MTETATAPAIEPVAGSTAPESPERFRDDQGRFVTASDAPAEDQAAEAATAEGQADQRQELDKPDPRRERSRQRWQEMKGKVREAQQQAAYWKNLAQQKIEAASKPLDPMGFQSDAEYNAAVAAQAMQKVTAQDHLHQARTIEHQAAVADQQAIGVQVEALRDQIKDIDIIYANPMQGGPMISEAMAAVIQDSEHGALLAYHLAKHPDKAVEIYDLPPLAAARALGKLEAGLSQRPVNRVSRAPQPVQIVSGGSGSNGVNPETMSFKEYEKWRMSGNG